MLEDCYKELPCSECGNYHQEDFVRLIFGSLVCNDCMPPDRFQIVTVKKKSKRKNAL